MSTNKIIRNTMKKTLVPFLTSEGFTGKFPNFQRKQHGTLHLLAIEFDKWNGGFFIELSTLPSGPAEMAWGEVVPEAQLTVAHTAVDTRARLQENSGSISSREDWFRFENLSGQECEKLIDRVISLFPQVNDWLRSKTVGPNICSKQ